MLIHRSHTICTVSCWRERLGMLRHRLVTSRNRRGILCLLDCLWTPSWTWRRHPIIILLDCSTAPRPDGRSLIFNTSSRSRYHTTKLLLVIVLYSQNPSPGWCAASCDQQCVATVKIALVDKKIVKSGEEHSSTVHNLQAQAGDKLSHAASVKPNCRRLA